MGVLLGFCSSYRRLCWVLCWVFVGGCGATLGIHRICLESQDLQTIENNVPQNTIKLQGLGLFKVGIALRGWHRVPSRYFRTWGFGCVGVLGVVPWFVSMGLSKGGPLVYPFYPLHKLHHRRPQTVTGTSKKQWRQRETKGDKGRQRETRSPEPGNSPQNVGNL